MKMNKYVIKNEVSGIYDGIFLFKTDAMASRKVTFDFLKIDMFDLRDLSLLCIGTFDTETGDDTIFDEARLVPFDNRYIAEHECSADVKDVSKDISSIR